MCSISFSVTAKRVVATFVFVSLLGGVPLWAQRDIAGDYRCSGMSGGKGYVMDLTVSPLQGSFEWAWSDERGVLHAGISIEKDGYLAVALLSAQGIGVAMYQFEEGTLRGEWFGGKGEIEREVCTPKGRIRA